MQEKDEIFNLRCQKVQNLRESGVEPYCNTFPEDPKNTPLISADTFFSLYENEEDSDLLQKVEIRHAVAGRVMAINKFGKAAFIRIQDASVDTQRPGNKTTGRLQLFVQKNTVGEAAFAVFKKIDVGDFIGVTGGPVRTKTGELTLLAESLVLLTKSLRPLPEKWHGLTDLETRYRQRYLDLIMNASTREIFIKRSQIISRIRAFFVERGFLEVETPMLQSIPGGGAAKPFVTHHNTLDMELYLRIAPELYLKRLVVGGLERVFEINRNFRNEGISTVHNPEFTMLEFYQAYATYLDLMNIGEELIGDVVEAINGRNEIEWCGQKISLARPFARFTMQEAICAHSDLDLADLSDEEKIRTHVSSLDIKTASQAHGHQIAALFEHYAESKLIQPTFIYDFPLSISPLSRKKTMSPDLVERFELFIGGREIANAFSELNDPLDQRERFEEQCAAKQAGDDEAHAMDEDYVRALEYGMPPTGGFGLGIDRFIMLLTSSNAIRDVILFPQLRPEK